MFRTITVSAFIDEMTKLANAAQVAAQAAQVAAPAAKATQGFIMRNAKPLGYMALGGGLALQGRQMYHDYNLGNQVRKQNEAQGMY